MRPPPSPLPQRRIPNPSPSPEAGPRRRLALDPAGCLPAPANPSSGSASPAGAIPAAKVAPGLPSGELLISLVYDQLKRGLFTPAPGAAPAGRVLGRGCLWAGEGISRPGRRGPTPQKWPARSGVSRRIAAPGVDHPPPPLGSSGPRLGGGSGLRAGGGSPAHHERT